MSRRIIPLNARLRRADNALLRLSCHQVKQSWLVLDCTAKHECDDLFFCTRRVRVLARVVGPCRQNSSADRAPCTSHGLVMVRPPEPRREEAEWRSETRPANGRVSRLVSSRRRNSARSTKVHLDFETNPLTSDKDSRGLAWDSLTCRQTARGVFTDRRRLFILGNP